MCEEMSNVIVSTVPDDGLAASGSKASYFSFLIYQWFNMIFVDQTTRFKMAEISRNFATLRNKFRNFILLLSDNVPTKYIMRYSMYSVISKHTQVTGSSQEIGHRK